MSDQPAPQTFPRASPAAVPARPAPPAWHRLRSLLLPVLVLALGLGITLLLWRSLVASELLAHQTEFELRAQAIAARVEQRLQAYEEVLHGARGLFAASDAVTRTEFREYVNSLYLQETYPGIQGIGHARLIPAADKQAAIAAIRREAHPGFSIWPEGRREPYTAIVYLEPFRERNLRALGYDMYAEPIRRKAMQAARDNDAVTASGKLVLVQEAGKDIQPGFLMFLPLYQKDAPHNTQAERRANIVGWVYAPFRVGDLMTGILGNAPDHDIALDFHDGSDPTPQSLLYHSIKHPYDTQSRFETVRRIHFSGHEWRVKAHSLPAFEARLHTGWQHPALLFGGTVSFLLALLSWSLLTGRDRALAAAARMTLELRESESRYRQMFESTTSVACLIDPQDGRIVDANPAAAAFWGYPLDELRRMNIGDINTAPRDLLQQRMAQVRSGELRHAEFRHRLKNGEIRDVQIDSGPVTFDGQVLLYSLIHDDTARKRAEAALQESEQRWKFALEGTGDGVWDWNIASGDVLYSKRLTDMLGYGEGELQSRLEEWSQRIHPADQPRVWADLQAYFDGQSPHYANEHRLRCKDGSWKWILDRGMIVSRDDAGKPLRMIGTHSDISQRKQFEETLRASEQRFRDLVNTTDGIVWEADAETFAFTFVGKQAENLLGYTTEEWTRPGFWVEHLHPEDRTWAPQYCASCTGRLQPHDFEYRFIAKDGRTVWLRDLVTVVAEDGKPRWLRGIMVDISAHKALEEHLTREKALLRTLIDAIPDIIFFKDTAGVYLGGNHALEKIFGSTEAEIIGKTDFDFVDEKTAAFFRAKDQEMLAAGHPRVNEEWVTYPDGRQVCLETMKTPLRGADGQVSGLIGVARDITERRAREEDLRRAGIVFDNVDNGVFITGPDNRILSVNPAFTRITGYSEEDVAGKDPGILSSHRHPPGFFSAMWSVLSATGSWSGEVVNRRKDGEIYVEWLSITAVKDAQDQVSHYVAVFSDITTRKEDEARVQHLAHYDVLTELPNRALLSERLHQALAMARREHSQLAVLFLDLDRFKPVNDTLGHDMGDLLLRAVAERLLASVQRESDTVARLGGDEFVVLLQSLEAQADAQTVAGKILHALSQPFDLAGHTIRISSSIGIALYPEHGASGEQLITHADLAMYHAKRDGPGRYRLFTASMQQDPRTIDA